MSSINVSVLLEKRANKWLLLEIILLAKESVRQSYFPKRRDLLNSK